MVAWRSPCNDDSQLRRFVCEGRKFQFGLGRGTCTPKFAARRSPKLSGLIATMADDTQQADEEHTPSNTTFSSLGLDKWLVDALAAMSIKRPTPIQAACIQPALEGIAPCGNEDLLCRKRLYWRCKDWVRKNNSLRCSNPTELVKRSIRNIRSSIDPDKRTRSANRRPIPRSWRLSQFKTHNSTWRDFTTHSSDFIIPSTACCCCYSRETG